MEREITVPLVSVGGLFNMDIHMGHFRDKGEEIEYLQQAVRHLQKQLDESKHHVWQLNNESEEFRENSWQLEKELENSLDQAEKHNHDLKQMYNKLENESDELKKKICEVKKRNDLLTTDLLKCKEMENQWTNRMQQMEQENDDLERALRAAQDCKDVAQQHLDEVLEREVIRDGEMEELALMIQQLQEQNKDLVEEIKVRDKLSALEKSRKNSRGSKISIETQTEAAVRPFRNKVSRALHRTRELGRSLSCMSRDNAS